MILDTEELGKFGLGIDEDDIKRYPRNGPAANELFPSGMAEPDGKFVDALLHTMDFFRNDICDKGRRESGMSDAISMYSFERDSRRFYPPRRLIHEDKYRRNAFASAALNALANLAVWKAQAKAFGDASIATIRALPEADVLRCIGRAYSTAEKKERLALEIDTRKGDDPELIRAKIETLEAEVRKRVREEIVAVLKDQGAMQEIRRRIEVEQAILPVVLKQEIVYLEYLRDQTEMPEDREAFVRVLNEAMQALEINDLEVELLKAEDALIYGAAALYKPARSREEKSKICIPMSLYGTATLLEWDDILKHVAHEVAHHVLREKQLFKNGQQITTREDHNAFHTITTGMVLKRLRNLDIGWGEVLDYAEMRIAPEEKEKPSNLAFTEGKGAGSEEKAGSEERAGSVSEAIVASVAARLSSKPPKSLWRKFLDWLDSI